MYSNYNNLFSKEQQNNEKAINDLNLKILDQQGSINKTEKEIYHEDLSRCDAGKCC